MYVNTGTRGCGAEFSSHTATSNKFWIYTRQRSLSTSILVCFMYVCMCAFVCDLYVRTSVCMSLKSLCTSVLVCVVYVHILVCMSIRFVCTYGVATISSLNLQVSFAKEPYKRDDILQKRPIILRSLLIVATAYEYVYAICVHACMRVCVYACVYIPTCRYIGPFLHFYMYLCVHIRHEMFERYSCIVNLDLIVYTCIYMYICICIHINTYISTYTYIYVYIYIYICICKPIYMHIYMCIHVHVCMYMYIDTYIHIKFTYIYTHIYM